MDQRAICLLAAAMLATAPAFAQQSPAQAVDFVRGCWVDKGSSGAAPQAFLRLLPGAPNGSTLSGMITPATDPASGPPMTLSFARDGSKLTLQHPLAEGEFPSARITVVIPPATMSRASFAAPKGEDARWVVVEGDKDRLQIFVVAAHGAMGIPTDVIFSGERDGCD